MPQGPVPASQPPHARSGQPHSVSRPCLTRVARAHPGRTGCRNRTTCRDAAKNPLGWVWDTPGSEVHIIPIFRDGTLDVHLGAGTGPVRPLWVQRELRYGGEIFGRRCGNFDRPLQETQTFEENRSSEPSQINNKRLRATGKSRPP